MKCEICHQAPPNGPTIYRINAPGEMPARWRCQHHLTTEQRLMLDQVMVDIVKTIEPIICRACGCIVDAHGCGCNPHDA